MPKKRSRPPKPAKRKTKKRSTPKVKIFFGDELFVPPPWFSVVGKKKTKKAARNKLTTKSIGPVFIGGKAAPPLPIEIGPDGKVQLVDSDKK